MEPSTASVTEPTTDRAGELSRKTKKGGTNMKTSFIKFAAAAAIAVASAACSKEIATTADEAAVASKVVTLKATVAANNTKVVAEETVTGIDFTFEVEDIVWVFDAEGNKTDFTVTEVNEGIATLSGTPETEIAAGDPITAVVKTAAVKSYDATNKVVKADLSASQTGTLESAAAHTVLVATTNFGEDITFEQNTTIYKFVLSVPAGETPTGGYNWYLSTGGTGSKDYINAMTVGIDGAVTLDDSRTSQSGDIKISNTVATADGKFTVYVSAPVYKVQNAIMQCTPSGQAYDRYVWHIAGATALVPAAGYTYTITRTAPQICHSSANAGSYYLIDNSAATVNGTAIPANTTGKPKLTVISEPLWGYTYPLTVLQAEESDFIGSWDFKGDTRNATVKGTPIKATETIAKGSGDYPNPSGQLSGQWYDNDWVAPAAAANTVTHVTLAKSADATYNLTMTGLFADVPMPAKFKLDYENHSFTAALRIENKAYQAGTGTFAGEWVAYETELQNRTGTAYWQLGFANGGAFDYAATVTVADNGTTTLSFSNTQTCTAYTTYKVVGIIVNRFVVQSTGGNDMVRSRKSIYCKQQNDRGGSAYAQVTQGVFTLTK